MSDKTMVEIVARAIAERRRDRDQQRANESGVDILLAVDSYLPTAREDARAALSALSTPTEAMVEAGHGAYMSASDHTPGSERIAWAWRAMINAAMNEGKA